MSAIQPNVGNSVTTASDPLTTALRWSTYGLLISMPLSFPCALGRPVASGILPLYVSPAVELSDVFGIILMLLSALQVWQRRLQRIATNGHHWPFVLPLLGLGGLGLVSATQSLAPLLAVYTAARWLFAAGLVWAIARAPLSRAQLVFVLLLAISAQALVALAQTTLQSPLGLPGEMTLALDNPAASTVHVHGRLWLRSYGLTFHPNVLAGFLTVGLLTTLPLLASRLPRLLWWLLAIALATTLSRSAFLALAITLVPASAWAWRNKPELRRPLLITAFGLICLSTAIGWHWRAQLRSRVELTAPNKPFSLQYVIKGGRLEMARVAWRTIIWRPLRGVGAGNFPLAMRELRSTTPPQFVHNVPLLIAAEVGIGGLLLWVALFVLAARTWLRRTPRDPWVVVASSAWVALGIIGLFDCYPWSLNAGRLLSVTVLALLQRSTWQPRGSL